MSAAAPLSEYFQAAQSWDSDRAAARRRDLYLAWLLAAAGWVATLVSVAAIALLMPLKRVEPFVIRVDSSTGVVDVVPVYAGEAGAPETVTRYFLTHYLTVCERFNFATAESDYEECGAFHSAQRNQAWYAEWNPTNPASPLNLHKDGSSVRVEVASVSFFTRASGLKDLAQVRYLKAERPQGGVQERVSHWIATVQYAYVAPAQDPRVRRWNPLGFKVIDFRTEPEALEPQGTAADAGAGRSSP